MDALVEVALAQWDLITADYEFIAARENSVYKVQADNRAFALRLHRQGYRSDDELTSELEWMAAVSAGDLHVPEPIANKAGTFLTNVDGIQIDLLSWLSGRTMQQTLEKSDQNEREALFHRLGQAMAHLHLTSDAWAPPTSFTRCSWDAEGLVGHAPLWDRFWDNPALDRADRSLFLKFRDTAFEALTSLTSKGADHGLIHADLVPANVIVDRGQIHMIDFDDGGFGFRLFDIATALLKHNSAPDFKALEETLLSGYRSVRTLDASALNLFIALRAATYVGWNITRMGEANGEERNARFIKTARDAITAYLNEQGYLGHVSRDRTDKATNPSLTSESNLCNIT